jgi:enamine deaminase RidA (YjgF/YER057c/UK114 family)
VSGTAARQGGDAYEQTREAITRALAAVVELGASKEDVLRTRLLLTQGCDWQGRSALTPRRSRASTREHDLLRVGIHPDDVLVEVELDAVVAEPPR